MSLPAAGRNLAAALTRAKAELGAKSDFGQVFVRLAFGYHLIQYTWEEVLLGRAHLGFAAWLAQLGVPAPQVMAYVALGSEFVGGCCWILGWAVRPLSALLVVNFAVALCLVHSTHPYERRFEAVQMLAVSLCLLWAGAGRLSLDAWRARRRQAVPADESAS